MSSFCRSIRLIRIGVLVKHKLLELRNVRACRCGVHLIHLESSVGIAVVHTTLFAVRHKIWICAASHVVLSRRTLLIVFLIAAFWLLEIIARPLSSFEELLVQERIISLLSVDYNDVHARHAYGC